MLTDPSPVDSFVFAGGDHRSPSREISGSNRDRSRSRSSRFSPSRGRDSREECRLPILGLGGRMAGLASCALAPWTVRGRWTQALSP